MFLDPETKTMIATGSPRQLLAKSDDPRVIRFLMRGEPKERIEEHQEIFKEKRDFVILFDSPLNGLNIGAPVKLQGVQVGAVKEIVLQMGPQGLVLLKPVVIELEPGRLLDSSGRPLKMARTEKQQMENTKRLIDAGLKARLEMQSLLTGLLYVELNFYPNEPVKLTGLDYKGLPELPSLPTTMEEMRNTVDKVLTQVRELPLETVLNNLSETLIAIRDTMKSEEVKRTLAIAAKTIEEAEKLVASLDRRVEPLLKDARETIKDTRSLVRDFNERIKPVLVVAEQALHKGTIVLEESRGMVNGVEVFAAPDSTLQQTLGEVRAAARSIRDLTDYLERHPDSVIFGKP
jgi:paraquat-inducible protein B